jgi:molecular chaperone HscA
VGGSSRISLIETKIKQEFGQSPLCSINPDEVVALGAAIHAQELQTQENDLLLLDVTPLSLGLETMGKLMEVVIPRNTTIPVKKRQEFTTYKNGQTSIDINIYQGERQEVSECIFLGKFKVDNLSPSSAGAVKISVDFEINENGILTVSSHEIGKKDIKKITLNPTDNLENSAIIEMLTQSQKNFAKDVQKRILIESKQKANQIIEMLTQAIEENKSLLEKNEEKSIFAQIKNIENISLPSQEKENKDLSKLANNINKQVDILDNMSSNFMQKIMDEAINKAMVNKSIENI